jgi:hypothetical protein
MLEEEHRWLSMIKPEEIKVRYYNLQTHHFGHWSSDENNKLTVGQKISKAHSKHPDWGGWARGISKSVESKEKLRIAAIKQYQDPEAKKILSEKVKEMWQNPAYRNMQLARKQEALKKAWITRRSK